MTSDKETTEAKFTWTVVIGSDRAHTLDKNGVHVPREEFFAATEEDASVEARRRVNLNVVRGKEVGTLPSFRRYYCIRSTSGMVMASDTFPFKKNHGFVLWKEGQYDIKALGSRFGGSLHNYIDIVVTDTHTYIGASVKAWLCTWDEPGMREMPFTLLFPNTPCGLNPHAEWSICADGDLPIELAHYTRDFGSNS